jgi:hypothetical protein
MHFQSQDCIGAGQEVGLCLAKFLTAPLTAGLRSKPLTGGKRKPDLGHAHHSNDDENLCSKANSK